MMSDDSASGADRRVYPRGSGACELIHEGNRYALRDWSAGGCAVEGSLPGAEKDARLQVQLVVSGPRSEIRQRVQARVVRLDRESVALEFTDLSIEERDLLLIAQGAFSENLFVMDLTEDSLI